MYKKSIVTLFAAFITLSSVFAKEPPLTVISGDLSSALAVGGAARFEIDFSNAQIGSLKDGDFVNKETVMGYEEYLKTKDAKQLERWEKDLKGWRNIFIVTFNKKNKKGLQLDMDEGTNHDYTVRLVVEKCDFGDLGKSIASHLVSPLIASRKTGGATLIGRVEFVGNQNKEVLCDIKIDGVSGTGSASIGTRMVTIFMDIAKYIFKIKK